MPPSSSASASGSRACSSRVTGKRVQKGEAAAATGKGQEQTAEAAVLPMGKLLASTEKRTRDAAVRSLASFLAQTGDQPISRLEMAKLWKGIFYCFWMSDKPLVQQALAQELADLVLTVPGTSRAPAPAVAGFEGSAGEISMRVRGGLAMLEGFWDAMAREWSGLDKWRINKFYLLLRRFINAAFRLLARDAWDAASVEHFGRLLVKTEGGGPLCANDPKVPDSLTYHLTDVYLEELERALGSASEDEKEDGEGSSEASFSLTALLQPMARTVATCHSSTVYDKIMDNVLQPLLDDCLVAAASQDEGDDDEGGRSAKRRKTDAEEEEEENDVTYPQILSAARKTGQSPLALRKAVYRLLFEAASRADALPQRRRRLYALCQKERERREEEEDEEDDE